MEQKNDNSKKVKLLCSYGGKIQSRPTDYQLSYVGGDTKILAVERATKFSEIVAKLNSLSKRDNGGEISVKYQLPGEDLDSLVSLIDDEDVEHMMVEYDRMQRSSTKPPRLRIFVFNILAPPVKAMAVEPTSATNPDYLFGFDTEYQPSFGPPLDLPGCCFNNAAIPAVYPVQVAVKEGVYRSGYGNREQPVYNIVPMMPAAPVSEQRIMVSMGNRNLIPPHF